MWRRGEAVRGDRRPVAVVEDAERPGRAGAGRPSQLSVLFPLSGINGVARRAVRQLPHAQETVSATVQRGWSGVSPSGRESAIPEADPAPERAHTKDRGSHYQATKDEQPNAPPDRGDPPVSPLARGREAAGIPGERHARGAAGPVRAHRPQAL